CRLFWLVVILASLSGAAYIIHQFQSRYHKFDISTKVTIEYNQSMTFPAVTLCNLNQFRRSKFDNATLDLLVKAGVLFQKDPNDWTAYSEAIESDASFNFSFVTHSFEEMLMECLWNGFLKCVHQNFTASITDLGVCYTFNNPSNVDDALVVNKPGIDHGLTLTLDIDQDEYITGDFKGAGVKVCMVVLHPQGVRPLMMEGGVVVSPGFETLVSIKHTKSLSQPHPYSSNCTEDSLKYSKVYTVPLCLHECKVDYVTKKCGCRDPRYPEVSSTWDYFVPINSL
ncbi:acid-sensing ion channel 2-like, partial [Amphiura filiformis]|uniref:acid-sensing ion channel 2-like n=1 Tax=Amphiura filiformis TaxID=82378 RepID=UPI003B2227AA